MKKFKEVRTIVTERFAACPACGQQSAPIRNMNPREKRPTLGRHLKPVEEGDYAGVCLHLDWVPGTEVERQREHITSDFATPAR